MAETPQPKCGSSEIIAEVDALFRVVVMSGVSHMWMLAREVSHRNQTHGDHARDEFMKQILWLRASGAGLSSSKIDAVNYDDQVVALLHSPQRDAIRKVDVHAVFGSLYEARCACRLLLGTFAGLIRAVSLLYAVHCMCEALCKLRGAICANIRAAWTCERTRSTRRRVCVCHLCCLRVR